MKNDKLHPSVEEFKKFVNDHPKVLGEVKTVNAFSIAFMKGDERIANFMIEVSEDGKEWRKILETKSSGRTNDLEGYSFLPISARYVRAICDGNDQNKWNSITEFVVYGN